MKKSGKVFCLLFTVLMLFTLSVTAFAGNETNDSNIRIEVTTDKNSYKAWGVAEITATITNVSGEDISNVTAQAVFNDLAPAGKRTSETSKSVDVLKSGESFSFTYKATLNKSEHKLNIIEKIILFFVRLFNGGYNADNNNIDVVAENVTEIEFGKYTAENVIQVGYGETSYYSTKDIKDKHIVGDEVSQFMSSEVYQSMEEDEKANSVIELLSKYEADGLIEKGSINYNEATKAIHFNYASGIPSVVLIKTEKKYSDPRLNPIGLVNNDSTTFTRQNESSTITKSNSNNPIKSVLMYGFDKPGADNRVLSAWSNSCESKTGMQTTILDCPTVYEFKTALLDKDYICIFEHGNYGGILADTYVFKVQNEEVTEATDIAYDTDIYFKRIIECYDDNGEKVYCITPNFFEFYYKDKLTDSIVYLISCQGFGVDSIVDYGIADILIEQCGVKTVVGFHNSVAQCYAFRIYDEITDLLLKGFTIGEAYDCTIDELGATDYTFLKEHLFEVEDMSTRREWLECANEKKENGAAAFLLNGDKSATLIAPATITGTVTDSETGNPISNVNVEVIDNESDSLDPIVTATTDSNGKYTLKLPYSDYSLSYKHSDYEDYGTSLTVNYESYTKDVTLSPKGSDSGDDSTGESGDTEEKTVTASGECGADGDNVTWTLYEDGELVISGSGEMADYVATIRPWYNHYNEITTITIQQGITSIGHDAFDCCSNTSEVNISESVISIGRLAFGSCKKLTQIFIPKNISEIHYTAFNNCSNLEEIDVDNDNENYTSENGVLFNNDKTILVRFPMAHPDNAYSIPKTVIEIGEVAFLGCENLTNVSIPTCVEIIANTAFNGCYNLEGIYIPYNVKSLGVNYNDNNSSNKHIFDNCSNLSYIDVDPQNEYYASIDGVLFNKSYSELLRYPSGKPSEEYVVPSSTKIIRNSAFSNSDKLESVIITDNVETIEKDVFYWSAVKNIELGTGLGEINGNTFSFCHNLNNVIIPENVIMIDAYAFYCCMNLDVITIYNPNCSIYDSETTIHKYYNADYQTKIKGYKGSTAQNYADKYGRTFVALD